jgi:ring-1,2-phenylacetyl-CoA epoxidase subunit PaaB
MSDLPNDTQWPRYQVFLQERPGQAYMDVGSVHAPDAELALFNARDVFVRRPQCSGLWVVPVEAIYSRTAEELAAENASPIEADAAAAEVKSAQLYYVFCKQKSAGTQTQVGQVEAVSPAQAMQLAVAAFDRPAPKTALAWWVLPVGQVTANDPQDGPSLFSPAEEKPFRLSTDFHTVTAMRKIKK